MTRPQQQPELYEKPLPSSEDAERVVLGSVFVDNQALVQLIEKLKPEDFYNPFHKRVYSAMISLMEQSKVIDIVLVAEEMRKEAPQDTSTVMKLINGLPHISSLVDYIDLIKDNSTIRQLIRTCNALITSALEGEKSAAEMLEEAESRIYGIETGNPFSTSVLVYPEVKASIERAEVLQSSGEVIIGIPSGLTDVDKKLRGFRAGNQVILAARPGAGKTALELKMLFHAAARLDEAVCMFSLEMSKEECVDRIICAEAGIDTERYAEGNLTQSEWDKVKEVREQLKTAPFFINDSPFMTTRGIRIELRRLNTLLMKEGKRVAIFAVDHIGLLRCEDNQRNKSREQEVSSFSRDLKIIAREFECTSLALCQMNRQVEGRSGHWPQLSDLRDSGSIEQDADIVAFIHREDMYEQDKSKHNNTAHFIIAKSRNGPTGFTKLQFTPKSTRFGDLAYQKQIAEESQRKTEDLII